MSDLRQKLKEYLVKRFPDVKDIAEGFKVNLPSLNTEMLTYILDAPAKTPELLIKRSGTGIMVRIDFRNIS